MVENPENGIWHVAIIRFDDWSTVRRGTAYAVKDIERAFQPRGSGGKGLLPPLNKQQDGDLIFVPDDDPPCWVRPAEVFTIEDAIERLTRPSSVQYREQDFLEANLSAIEGLLSNLTPSDFVLRANLESRRDELRDQLKQRGESE